MRVFVLLSCLCAGQPTGAQDTATELLEEFCDRGLLVALHRRLEPAVEAIAAVHFNFTGDRHYEVVEIVSVFQVSRLCRSALRYVESLRLALSFLVCPPTLAFPDWEALGADDRVHGLLGLLGLQEHLDEFFADVRYLAAAGGPPEEPETEEAWGIAESELREVSLKLEAWVGASCMMPGRRLGADAYWGLDPVLHRLLTMVGDFLVSLAGDLNTFFRIPNLVSHEMLPTTTPLGRPVTASLFRDSPGGQALRPSFMAALRHAPATVVQPDLLPVFRQCRSALMEAGANMVARDFMDTPVTWAHRDVSGVARRMPSPLQLLQASARSARLSNLFISVQVSSYLLTPEPHCGSRLVLYDPSHCLLEQGWGGYFFHMNPLPPFNLTVVYAGKPLGPGASVPPTDVHSIHVPSMDTQWSSLVSTFKSMNHHSPDMLFISPLVGNCQILDRLLATGTIRPKLLYLPINPLVPPPGESKPDFFEWWASHGPDFMQQLTAAAPSAMAGAVPVTASMWQAQCSLATAAQGLERHGYALLHVEHTFAAFLWRPLHQQLTGAGRAAAGSKAYMGGEAVTASGTLRSAWLAGWHCSPHARHLFDLEAHLGVADPGAALASAGVAAGDPKVAGSAGYHPADITAGHRERMRMLAATLVPEAPTLRYFLEHSAEGQPARGRCGEGFCECFPPYRGPLCELEDKPLRTQRLRAVIHYVTADTEGDMLDLERSLGSLWLRFNRRRDYPVVVFHEGLSAASRHRLVYASENRVWLVLLPRFKEIPQQWAKAASEMAQDFSVGYCAMTRWRSGPIFLEPVLASFDYAMTLDTDSYFPADILSDPFDFLHQQGLVAAFPHLGRESASVVVNFMHYFLIYCRLLGLHPRRTRMLASLIESNFKWYQQCLMLDIEILRLDWFRGQKYQDMFQFMDSTGGFWLHRWGNNPFRTFAVGLLLQDSDVKALVLPYAHQDYCSCGPGTSPCEWDPERGLHRCKEGPPVDGPGLAAGELDEGLLDLQPWRGTARQKSKFVPKEILQFVDEHLPA